MDAVVSEKQLVDVVAQVVGVVAARRRRADLVRLVVYFRFTVNFRSTADFRFSAVRRVDGGSRMLVVDDRRRVTLATIVQFRFAAYFRSTADFRFSAVRRVDGGSGKLVVDERRRRTLATDVQLAARRRSSGCTTMSTAVSVRRCSVGVVVDARR